MKHKTPITVGIIGHLDAIITEAHKRKIEKIFSKVKVNGHIDEILKYLNDK